MEDTKRLKQQHFDSYKKSVIDLITNNSNLLLKEDIASLIKKPPLNSMDRIKNKLVSVAKKNELVVDSDKLEKSLEKYRKEVLSNFDDIIDSRVDYYSKIVNRCTIDNTIKVLKKDINSYDNKIKKDLKDIIIKSLNDNVTNNVSKIIKELDEKEIKTLNKYLNNMYVKELLENIDIKILVKDATMINSIKEATDTYLFTLNNSRLFNDLD